MIAIPSHFLLSQTSLPFLLKYVLITVGNSKIEYFLKTILIFIFSFVFNCKHFLKTGFTETHFDVYISNGNLNIEGYKTSFKKNRSYEEV